MPERLFGRLGLCILISIVIVAVFPVAVSTSTANSTLEIRYDEVYSSTTDKNSSYFEAFIISTVDDSTFELGPGSAYAIQVIKTETDEKVTVSIQNQTDSIERVTIQPGDGVSPVSVSVAGGGRRSIDSTLQGDVGMFQTETFAKYEVQIVNQSGTVVAKTDPQVHGVGYKPDIEYNGSAIAVSGDEKIRSDWYVELQQNVTGNAIPEKILEFRNQASTDYFVASVRNTEFKESREFAVEIRENKSEAGGEVVVRAYQLEITSERRVNGPVGNKSTNDDPGPGYSDPLLDQYDGDNDGTISIGELGTAASDYAQGNLSIRELGKVAGAYARS